MAARVNLQVLRNQIDEQLLTNKSVRREFFTTAREEMSVAKQEALKEFDNHLVTKELASKENGENISNTLPKNYGNLYSFIGFEKGESPEQDLRSFINENIRIRNLPTVKKTEKFVTFSYPVDVPTIKEVEGSFPMPWPTSKSWVTAISDGIPGFHQYLYEEGYFLKGSRSGPAVQVKRDLRAGEFKPVPYFRDIIVHFEQRVKGKR